MIIHKLDLPALTVERSEVARLLGYPPGPMPRRVMEVVADAETNAASLIHPVGAYALTGRATLAASGYLRDVGRAALCVVSIGGALERRVDAYRAGGLLGPALILDACGSAAAEAAADAAEVVVRAALERDAVRCSRRFSPGYGGWDVAEQRWLLGVLRAHEIGVTLTEGCMMAPRKSVSFAMTVGENPIEFFDDDICASCGAVDCRWRDTPHKCPGRQTR